LGCPGGSSPHGLGLCLGAGPPRVGRLKGGLAWPPKRRPSGPPADDAPDPAALPSTPPVARQAKPGGSHGGWRRTGQALARRLKNAARWWVPPAPPAPTSLVHHHPCPPSCLPPGAPSVPQPHCGPSNTVCPPRPRWGSRPPPLRCSTARVLGTVLAPGATALPQPFIPSPWPAPAPESPTGPPKWARAVAQ